MQKHGLKQESSAHFHFTLRANTEQLIQALRDPIRATLDSERSNYVFLIAEAAARLIERNAAKNALDRCEGDRCEGDRCEGDRCACCALIIGFRPRQYRRSGKRGHRGWRV